MIRYNIFHKQSRPWSGSSYKSCLIWVCSVCKRVKRCLYEVKELVSCLFLIKCEAESYIHVTLKWQYIVICLIRGPCSNRGPFPCLDAKNADFSSKFPKNQASNNGHPRILKKNRSYVMQKHLEFVISSKILVVRLQQIVPLNKVHCFWPSFYFVQKYRPSLLKVLSIPSAEKNFTVSIVFYVWTWHH